MVLVRSNKRRRQQERQPCSFIRASCWEPIQDFRCFEVKGRTTEHPTLRAFTCKAPASDTGAFPYLHNPPQLARLADRGLKGVGAELANRG